MKLLLHVDVPQVGYLGDVVEVSEGYARNYLLPQRMAVTPTQANMKAIEEERAQQAEVRRLAHEALKNVAQRVEGKEITLEVLANAQGHMFGSVSEEDVAKALRDQGGEVQPRDVVMPSHIRELGDHTVKLHFGEGIDAAVLVHVIRPEDHQSESEQESEPSDESVE